MIEYKFISHTDNFLKKVIELSDLNTKTLGLIPRKAFEESARNKCILVAKKEDELIGYCLFRKATRLNLIKITQLCVAGKFRGKGYSVQLFEKLKNTFQNSFNGIGLNCRTDYVHANKLWKKCGLLPLSEKKSRSKKEKYLQYWQLNFTQNNLFNQFENTHIQAVLDLNIIIKLRDLESEKNIEIISLFNENITGEVDFFYAKESLFEIQRDENKERRKKTRNYLLGFNPTESPLKEVAEIEEILEPIFNCKNENDLSDRRQVAETLASNIPYFITNDTGIIDKREKISDLYPIEILTPFEFIISLDQILNENKYVSQRFGGTNFKYRKAKSEELNKIVSDFLNKSAKEKKIEFENTIRITCTTNHSEIKVVEEKNEIKATLGFHRDKNRLIVNLLRSKKGPFRYLLLKQFLNECIITANNENLEEIIIRESNLDNNLIDILQSYRFIKIRNNWTKRLIREILSFDELKTTKPEIFNFLNIKSSDELNTEQVYEIERTFLPLKIRDVEVQNLIIPIKPYWASQLFDFLSAEGTFFGAKPSLVWNRENVYYRNIKPDMEKYPARILWYCSESKNYTRKKGIVACSYLDNVLVNKPKEIWRRFKKYGIYEWKNVYQLAKNDIENDIKVINFSDTEVFKNIVKLKDIREILNKAHTFQSPIRIDNEQYIRIYLKAKS